MHGATIKGSSISCRGRYLCLSGWRILHSEELNDLTSSDFGWSNRVAWDGQELWQVWRWRQGYARFWWRKVSKRGLGSARCKWNFNIKRGFMEICWKAWSALLWVCENATRETHLACGRFLRSVLSVIHRDKLHVTL